MTEFRSELMRLYAERGHIHQVTDPEALDTLAGREVVIGYGGFDATASSLHVGNLMLIMLLRRLQQAGHKPIVLMGGGTSKVGDPSFKDEARQLLDTDIIDANIASIQSVFEKFLSFGDGPTDAILVNNADWLDRLEYIPFLREVGRHFSVNRMLNFDSVKLRLDREQSLTFLEFNYMIMQAYDFLELARREACRLQLGGSDQWGNIVNGIELTRRAAAIETYGLTCPLITTADGTKMGKTVDGAVWLNGDMLSPYDYWQYWRNTQDDDVIRFMKLFTDLPLAEISEFEKLEGAKLNDAKKALANAATAMAHGEEAARDAADTAEKTFEQGAVGEDLPTLSVTSGEIALLDAMVGLGLVASKGEAKRLVRGGGARVDGEKIGDEGAMVSIGDAPVRISAGKKKHGVLTR